MAKLIYHEAGKKLYETGVSDGVLYPTNSDGTYGTGVAWQGLTSVQETPSGAESNPIYADNKKYLDIRSAEQFGATIQAYTFPKAFYECDGSAFMNLGNNNVSDFITVGQQSRKVFGLAYKTIVGNDTSMNDYSYKIHMIYGATASPSQREYQTVNESPEAIQFSWELTTTPIPVPNHKDSAIITVDVSPIAAMPDSSAEKTYWKGKIATLEGILWGTDPAYKLTEDTEIVTGKDYYTRSGTEGSYTYTKVVSPNVSDIATYYEYTDTEPRLIMPSEFADIFVPYNAG